MTRNDTRSRDASTQHVSWERVLLNSAPENVLMSKSLATETIGLLELVDASALGIRWQKTPSIC